MRCSRCYFKNMPLAVNFVFILTIFNVSRRNYHCLDKLPHKHFLTLCLNLIWPPFGLGFCSTELADLMASKLVQLQSKACQASQFVAKHGSNYYRQLLEQNKQYIQEPPTVEKCNLLAKQLFYTRLARLYVLQRAPPLSPK